MEPLSSEPSLYSSDSERGDGSGRSQWQENDSDEVVASADSTHGEDTAETSFDSPLSPMAKRRWYRDADLWRLVIMLCMLLALMCAEFAVGFITNSLALVSDAYHMASDSISIVVGIVALQLAKRNRSSKRFSYGLAAAETIGGLVNGVFLLSVCFFIVMEAIQRFIDVPEVQDPLLVVYIGAGGLAMNLLGLLLFMGHSGAGHGHSHGGGGGGHGHSHGHGKKGKKEKKNKKGKDVDSDEAGTPDEDCTEMSEHSARNDQETGATKPKQEKKHKKKKKAANHNLHAVFLHVLGDALGSLAAIISGLCIEFIPWGGRYYVDPALSVVIAAIITYSAIPLVWRCCVILMQSVPAGVDIERLTKDLELISMVVRVHDLHVWTVGSRQMATAHVLCPYGTEFMTVATQIKKTFHDYDIHFVTVQPEFMPPTALHPNESGDDESLCLLKCVNECDLVQEGKSHHRRRRPERSEQDEGHPK